MVNSDVWGLNTDTSGTWQHTNSTDSNWDAYFQAARHRGGGCNESSKHDNDEKALFHGLKSAYRMSREYDGSEYGTEAPQHDVAARIAANVAIAYLLASGQAFTREESAAYLEENYARDVGYAERFFGGEKSLADRIGPAEFEAAIAQAWHQTDGKANHVDGARTALAAAEAFLDETFDAAPLPLRDQEAGWELS